MDGKLIEEYVEESTWRTKANANHNKSFSGLQSHIAGTVLARDAITKFGRIGKRHLDGAYHLHNLEGGVYSKYCILGTTHIQTINSFKFANHIKVGDILIGYNEEKNRFEHTKVVRIMSRKVDELYELKLDKKDTRDVKLYITGNHKVLTNVGWKTVEELNIGDEILYLTQNRRKNAKHNRDGITDEEIYKKRLENLEKANKVMTSERKSELFKSLWQNENFRNKVMKSRNESGQYDKISEYMKNNNPIKGIPSECHPNWRGGRSFEPYCPKWRENKREEIRNLHDRKCFVCHKSEEENGKKLDVHHIDDDKQQGCNGKKWKLVPLCISCHNKTRWDKLSILENYVPENGAIVISKKLMKPKAGGKRKYQYKVYNFECYPHKNYLANGLIVHNCNGNDLLTLLQKGLINVGSVSAKPAKHFNTALDQIVNYTYLMTGEFMGAQAWRDLDILLAPFVYNDQLGYEQVKQEIQQLIWNLSFNLRPGYQSPFTNITFGLRPSKYYQELTVGIENYKTNTYADFQDEIDLINAAFLDVMIEGPGDGKPFTFPMPTYNITKDFKWDSEITDKIFQLASTWGTPYFANYINTDLSEEDSLSMCCRLKLNLKEVQKVSGGIWNFGANTGSLAVFTINMSRIGYLSNGKEEKFFKILDNILEDGRDYLIEKKKYIEQGTKAGLFPMTSSYIGEKLYKTYFLTIGINGLNECSVNFYEQDILQNINWCDKVLKYIAKKVLSFQQETGHLFNFEATPAEGCSYSLARLDQEKFPDIFTQGNRTVPYYTGSSLIPMNYDISLPDAVRHQEQLQQNYTGGTVFHIDLGEMAGAGAIKDLVRATCNHTKLPYLTWSPSYSICPIHGKRGGKESCCEQSQIFSRVVGYYRPVTRFNQGKFQEFKEKKFFRK